MNAWQCSERKITVHKFVEVKIEFTKFWELDKWQTTNFLKGRFRAWQWEKVNSYTVWATAGKMKYSMTICYYLLCGEHSRGKMIFLEETYHGKVVIWQMAGKTIKITVA